MEEYIEFNKNTIETAILKGAHYLLNSQNADGGIKFEDEGSVKSGIWVTAETLEFFLKSRVVPITVYPKIRKMIEFLLDKQNEDGSWTILEEDSEASQPVPSTIATGHCTYVLKLMLSNDFLYSDRINEAIIKGESWLRGCCIESDGYIFWGSTSMEGGVVDPNSNERCRMEYIFTSFYAMLGLISPKQHFGDNIESNKLLLNKANRFFINQSEWFIKRYNEDSIVEELQIVELAKVSSTFCRLVNALSLLNKSIPSSCVEGLSKIISRCSRNSFMTSSITVNTKQIRQYATTYNNNTPFDMGMALINLKSHTSILESIIKEYIKEQRNEGYWYLGFSSAYTIKTWSTAEALIVLECAFKMYSDIKVDERERLIERKIEASQKRINNLVSKNRYLRKSAIISTIISCILSALGIVAIVIWINIPANKDTLLSNILSYIIIPLSLNIIYEVVKSIKNRR